MSNNKKTVADNMQKKILEAKTVADNMQKKV